MADFAGFGDLGGGGKVGSGGGGGKSGGGDTGAGSPAGDLSSLGMDSSGAGGDPFAPTSLGMDTSTGLRGLYAAASPEQLAQAQGDPTGTVAAEQSITGGQQQPGGSGQFGTQSGDPTRGLYAQASSAEQVPQIQRPMSLRDVFGAPHDAAPGAEISPAGVQQFNTGGGVPTQPMGPGAGGTNLIPGAAGLGPGGGAAGNIMQPGGNFGAAVDSTVPASGDTLANRFGSWTTDSTTGATGPTSFADQFNQSLAAIAQQNAASGLPPGGTATGGATQPATNPLTADALTKSAQPAVPTADQPTGDGTTGDTTAAPPAKTGDTTAAPPAGTTTGDTTTGAPPAKTTTGDTTTGDTTTGAPPAGVPGTPGTPGTPGGQAGGFNPMQIISGLLNLARMAMGLPPIMPGFGPPFMGVPPNMPTGPGTPQPPTPQAPQPPTGAKAPEETGAGTPSTTAGATPATGPQPPVVGPGAPGQASPPQGGPQAGAPTQDLTQQTQQANRALGGHGANFMGSGAARQAGINIRPGSPQAQNGRITTASGRSVAVNSLAAPHFQSFIRELESRGYQIRSIGGYDMRYIKGTGRLSQHAYGNAIDINANQNWGARTNMPSDIAQIAARHGLFWGGNWRRPWTDSMHFEWSGAGYQAPRAGGQTSSLTPSLDQLAFASPRPFPTFPPGDWSPRQIPSRPPPPTTVRPPPEAMTA